MGHPFLDPCFVCHQEPSTLIVHHIPICYDCLPQRGLFIFAPYLYGDLVGLGKRVTEPYELN